MTQMIEDWIDKLKEEKPATEEGACTQFLGQSILEVAGHSSQCESNFGFGLKD